MPSAWPDGLLNASNVNLDSLAGVYVLDWSGLIAGGERDGAPGRKMPYSDGELGVATRTLAAFDMPIPLEVWAVDGSGVAPATSQGMRAQILANLAGIGAWLENDGLPGTYKRRHSDSAATYDETTASLAYVSGLRAAVQPGSRVLTTTLVLRNLDGCWLDGSTPVWP